LHSLLFDPCLGTGVGVTSVFEKSRNVKHSSEPEKLNGELFSLFPKFCYYLYFCRHRYRYIWIDISSTDIFPMPIFGR
jgi:hypothetical protein